MESKQTTKSPSPGKDSQEHVEKCPQDQQVDNTDNSLEKPDPYAPIKETTSYLLEKCPMLSKCKCAMVLGSGLGDFADNLKDPVVIPYSDIPNWKCSTAQGHKSQLVVGPLMTDPNTFLVFM